jgi:hypothetical protein
MSDVTSGQRMSFWSLIERLKSSKKKIAAQIGTNRRSGNAQSISKLFRRQALLPWAQSNQYALLVIGAGLLSALFVLYEWHPHGPSDAAISAARAHLTALNAQFDQVKNQSDIPPLRLSWSDVKFRFQSCGLEPLTPKNGPSTGGYRGGADHWNGIVTGPVSQVVSCALTIPLNDQFVPTAFSMSGNIFTLDYSVLGIVKTGVSPHE